eukprot:m.229746 g.229746  ORF g.229746 m.229746 type:complete len:114 (+) comp17056_c6_seq1:1909-2250(+)
MKEEEEEEEVAAALRRPTVFDRPMSMNGNDSFVFGDRASLKGSQDSLMAAISLEGEFYPTRSWNVFRKFTEHPITLHPQRTLRYRPTTRRKRDEDEDEDDDDEEEAEEYALEQ